MLTIFGIAALASVVLFWGVSLVAVSFVEQDPKIVKRQRILAAVVLFVFVLIWGVYVYYV